MHTLIVFDKWQMKLSCICTFNWSVTTPYYIGCDNQYHCWPFPCNNSNVMNLVMFAVGLGLLAFPRRLVATIKFKFWLKKETTDVGLESYYWAQIALHYSLPADYLSCLDSPLAKGIVGGKLSNAIKIWLCTIILERSDSEKEMPNNLT